MRTPPKRTLVLAIAVTFAALILILRRTEPDEERSPRIIQPTRPIAVAEGQRISDRAERISRPRDRTATEIAIVDLVSLKPLAASSLDVMEGEAVVGTYVTSTEGRVSLLAAPSVNSFVNVRTDMGGLPREYTGLPISNGVVHVPYNARLRVRVTAPGAETTAHVRLVACPPPEDLPSDLLPDVERSSLLKHA